MHGFSFPANELQPADPKLVKVHILIILILKDQISTTHINHFYLCFVVLYCCYGSVHSIQPLLKKQSLFKLILLKR